MSKHPIDAGHLNQYICGDQALLYEILTIFIEQAHGWAGRFDPTMTDAAWHDAAHALKGASRGVGAWALGDLAEAAERLVGSNDDSIAARQASVTAIREETHRTLAYAERMRAGMADDII